MPGDGERAAADVGSGNLPAGDAPLVDTGSLENGLLKRQAFDEGAGVGSRMTDIEMSLTPPSQTPPHQSPPGKVPAGEDVLSGNAPSGSASKVSPSPSGSPSGPQISSSANSSCVSSSFSPGSFSSMTSQDSFTGLIDESETGLAAGGNVGIGSELDHELRVVTARGTEHGLVLRIDGKADWTLVREELDHFLGGRRKFFEGGEVSIEWIDRLPTPEQGRELGDYLLKQYGLTVVTRRRRIAQGNSISGVSPNVPVSQQGAQGTLVPGPLAQGPSAQSPFAQGSAAAGGVPAGFSGQNVAPDSDSFSSHNIGTSPMNKAPGEHNFSNSFSEDGLEHMPAGSLPGTRGGVTINLFPQANSSSGVNSQGSHEALDPNEEELFVSGVVQSSRGTGLAGSRMMFEDDGGMFSSSSSSASSISPRRVASQMAKMLGGPDLFYEDDANAKILFGTLRSGQRVETPFSLIVVGDVNPGADLVAGGDIVVLGSLRGTAHASAYDDDSFDRVIIALQMQPMQLRIGSVLSRGSEEVVRGAEIARIENRRIVVEAFNPRMLWGRKIR